MSKKKAPPGLTNLERFGGGVFFVIYLLLLPLAAEPLLRLAGQLLGRRLTGNLGSVIYYYTLFAVTVILFHSLLATTGSASGPPAWQSSWQTGGATSTTPPSPPRSAAPPI